MTNTRVSFFFLLAFPLGLAPWPHPASACTVMRLVCGDRLLIARNHDWPYDGGLLIVNPRGLMKTSLSPIRPATWRSKFGSVSLTQYGRGIPFAGMNEAGLTVDLLQLPETRFPSPEDTRGTQTVNAIQWVQYQLDTAGSVAEVVASLERVLPVPLLPPIERVHYFINDAGGDAAVVEFLDGRPVVRHRRGTEPNLRPAVCALANSNWQDSNSATRFAADKDFSLKRYQMAVESTTAWDGITDPIDYAFACLQRVRQERLTQWNLVYEPSERRISFRTDKFATRRLIDLDDLDFSADRPAQMVEIQSEFSGDLSRRLRPFTSARNNALIDEAFASVPGFERVPDLIMGAVKSVVKHYPATVRDARASTP